METIKDFTYGSKLNQIKHDLEIYLDNGALDETKRRYGINPNSIVNLTIEDSLATWVTRGTISFFYNPEIKSNTYSAAGNKSSVTTGLPSNSKNKGFFIFRNDGNDFLRIRIVPDLEDPSNLKKAGIGNSISIDNRKDWTLSYFFSIYDMEDIDLPPGAQNAASSTIKCLKLYFWDSWYQKMITNTMQYSTGLSRKSSVPQAGPSPDSAAGVVYDNLGNIYTGEAMKEIIDLSLQKESSQEGAQSSSTADPILQLKYNPTATLGEDWDQGAAKIFYTAPAEATAYDSLMYVLDKHISTVSSSKSSSISNENTSTVNDFSILVKERGPTETDVGQLTLKPVSSYFKNVADYQVDHYFLQSYGSTKDSTSKKHRSPKSKYSFSRFNEISNYRFVDIASVTNSSQFCTTPVYSFDFNKRTFNVDFANNTVETARDFMSEKYIKNMMTSSTDDKKLFLISLDSDKKSKNIKPVFSLYGDDPLIRQHAGLQKLLYYGLFHNAAINFRTLGLPYREPGRFIAIDRTNGVDSGAFEDKFYGQWFIVSVKHVVEAEIYYNDITAVKIHRFDALHVDFNNQLED